MMIPQAGSGGVPRTVPPRRCLAVATRSRTRRAPPRAAQRPSPVGSPRNPAPENTPPGPQRVKLSAEEEESYSQRRGSSRPGSSRPETSGFEGRGVDATVDATSSFFESATSGAVATSGSAVSLVSRTLGAM